MRLTDLANAVNNNTMDLLFSLPATSKLSQLIRACQIDHELELRECHDGALIMECMECPFRRMLDDEEETAVRMGQKTEDITQELTLGGREKIL